jgi:polysaccharide biosynthesis protein PslH
LNILYVTREIPALDAGSLRSFHLLRHLSGRHAIRLLSFTLRPELARERLVALETYVADSSVVAIERGQRRGGILGALQWKVRAAFARRRALRRMRQLVREVLQTHDIDVVVLSAKSAVPALIGMRHVPVVVDCCDSAALRVREALRHARGQERLWLALTWMRLRRREGRLLTFSPDVAFASVRDQESVMGSRPDGQVIPNGIDLAYWTRRVAAVTPESILFFGVLEYEPNHDAAMWLIRSIFPRIKAVRPGATLTIVGREPRPDLCAAAGQQEGVTLTGRVADVRPYLERAAVACIPLRYASGIQNKVLEALAMQVPVVTTPPAADGLRLRGAGAPPLMVGDDEAELAAAVLRLLDDPDLAARLVRDGRDFVARHFQWATAAAQLEGMLERAAVRTRPDDSRRRRSRSSPAVT